MPIRILIADDHTLVRSALAATLGTEPGLDIVAEAADGEDAVEQALLVQPDVVLMDVTMPRLNGVEATRRLVACCPETKVIGLSMHGEDMMADRMRRAGAVAYLSKDAPLEDVIAAIRAAQ